MIKIVRSIAILSILFIINSNYNDGFLLYSATLPNINTQQDGTFTFTSSGITYSGNGQTYTGNTITIVSGGYVNGSIKNNGISNDVVNINSSSYNTLDGSRFTNFGESSSHLSTVNINNSQFLIGSDFYVNNLNLTGNSNLTLNSGDGRVDIGSIAGGSGTSITLASGITYSRDTTFGSSGNSIGSIQINDANLTINKDAYANNISLNNNTSSTLNLANGGKVHGTISGNGTVNINADYSVSDTVFGNSTNSLSTLNITTGNSLTLSNQAFIDKLNLQGNSSLNLNGGSGVNGNISGTGTVNIGANYSNSNTVFGNSTNHLSGLNVGNGFTFTLNNKAYVDNLKLSDANSTLIINGNGGVNGIISGSSANNGIVNINKNYDNFNTSSENYFDTTFGTDVNSLSSLIIGDSTDGYNLSLGNIAYVNLAILNNSSSSLTLNSGSGVVGLISGGGFVNLLENYTTTSGIQDIANSIYNTQFGASGNGLQTLNIGKNTDGINAEISVILNLDNIAYTNTINLSNNSQLTIEENGGVSGIIQGSSNNQGIVNIINKDFDTSNAGIYNTFFGTQSNYLKQVNITNNQFTLTNTAYMNNFNMTSNDTYIDTKRIFTMTSDSQFNGSITLNKQENDKLIGVILDENYLTSLSDLLSLINSGNNGTSSVNTGNELFLNLLNKNDLTEGKKITIDTGKDYTNAGLTYDGIFLNLVLDKSNAGQLDLVVEENKTPTLENVSQATLTTANIIDSWIFSKKSRDENILTANLQALTNKQEFFHALTNLTPDVSGINIKIPTQSIISAVANIDKRLNFLRIAKISENNFTFMNMLSKNLPPYYDEYIKKRNIWWEFFGGTLHQSNTENIFGYDANYYGGTIGYDIKINPNFVFGASYTFNQVDANDLDYIKDDRDDIKATTHNLDLYFMLYNKKNYLAFNLGGGFSVFDQKRKINFYNFHRDAKANYNGFSYYGGVEYGFNIMLYDGSKNKATDAKGEIDQKIGLYKRNKPDGYLMLTPKISLTYNNISLDKYTEKGADAANLVIDTKDYSSLDLNGGLSLTFSKGLNSYTRFQTMLNGFVSYGIINDRVELKARYMDDDQEFKVYGFQPDDFTYNLGVSFGFNFYDKFNISLGYNYTFADDFNGQLIKLSILYNF